MDETRWVTVKTGKPAVVELARTFLDDAGIPTRLPETPERHFGTYAESANPWELPLQVPEAYAEEATHLLARGRTETGADA